MNALITKTIATLTLTAAFASVSLQPLAAEPAARPAGNSSIKISFDDLDFSNPDSVATLYSRIEFSARLVCTDTSSPWDARRQTTYQRCYTATIADAVARVNQPQLTAMHRAKTKPALVRAADK